MPRGNPQFLETATPFKPGNKAPRRSAHVDRALRLARKFTPQAILYAGRVLRDEEMDPRYRIKAAELILAAGMPKGDAHKRHLESIEGGVGSLRVEFVAPDGSTVSFEGASQPSVAPPAFEVPFIDADMDSDAADQSDASNAAADSALIDE